MPQRSHMKQLIPPNLDTEGTAGYCLGYVSDVFGLTGTGAWATQCAERSNVRTDPLPGDVAVPLFWSGYATAGDGSKGDYGHIALWVPGQGIYSSPASGKGHLIWPDLATATATVSRWMQNAAYLGWALDLAGQPIAIEGEEDMPLTEDDLNNIADHVWAKAINGGGAAADRLAGIDANVAPAALSTAIGNADIFGLPLSTRLKGIDEKSGTAQLTLTADQIATLGAKISQASGTPATITLTADQIATLGAALAKNFPTNITLSGKVA